MEKKDWTTPELTVYGTVEKTTALINKDFGPTDGYTFQGIPITTTSP